MKKRFSRMMAIAIGAMLLLTPATPSLAYDEDDYDIGVDEKGEEFWYLDEYMHPNCSEELLIYLYVDNSIQGLYDGLYDKSYLTFDCYTNLPERYEKEGRNCIHLCKEFFLQEMTPSFELEHGDIYLLSDHIEPGTYTFCFPNAEGNNSIRVLSNSLQSPMVADSNAYYTEADAEENNLEVCTVRADGFGYPIYAYFGNEEWSSDPEVLYEFLDWAKENYAEFEKMRDDFYEINQMEIPDNVSPILDNLSNLGQEETVSDNFVSANGPTRVISTSTNVLEGGFPESDRGQKEEKKNNTAGIVVLAIIVAVSVGAYAFIKKKMDA